MEFGIFLPEDRSRVRVNLFIVFPRGDRIDPVVIKCNGVGSFKQKINSFEIAIFIQHSHNSTNNAFEGT